MSIRPTIAGMRWRPSRTLAPPACFGLVRPDHGGDIPNEIANRRFFGVFDGRSLPGARFHLAFQLPRSALPLASRPAANVHSQDLSCGLPGFCPGPEIRETIRTETTAVVISGRKRSAGPLPGIKSKASHKGLPRAEGSRAQPAWGIVTRGGGGELSWERSAAQKRGRSRSRF
jgi:hypothetical protein